MEESVARYLSQLGTADRKEPTEALATKPKHLEEKLVKLDAEMKRVGPSSSGSDRRMAAAARSGIV